MLRWALMRLLMAFWWLNRSHWVWWVREMSWLNWSFRVMGAIWVPTLMGLARAVLMPRIHAMRRVSSAALILAIMLCVPIALNERWWLASVWRFGVVRLLWWVTVEGLMVRPVGGVALRLALLV